MALIHFRDFQTLRFRPPTYIFLLIIISTLSCCARDGAQTEFEPKVIDQVVLQDTGFACLMTTDGKMSAGQPITAAVVLDECYGCSTKFSDSKCSFAVQSDRLVLSAVTTKTRYTSDLPCSSFCRLYVVRCEGPKLPAGMTELFYGNSATMFSLPATYHVSVPPQKVESCNPLRE